MLKIELLNKNNVVEFLKYSLEIWISIKFECSFQKQITFVVIKL